MTTYHRKVDKNQKEIVRLARTLGCRVQSLAACGQGVPDLLISYRGRNHLVEVKNGRNTLTPDQVNWIDNWNSTVHVIRTPDHMKELVLSWAKQYLMANAFADDMMAIAKIAKAADDSSS